MSEPVTAKHLNRAMKDKPGLGVPIAHFEDNLARREAPRLTAGKASRRIDLNTGELREHLLAARLDEAHPLCSRPASARSFCPTAQR